MANKKSGRATWLVVLIVLGAAIAGAVWYFKKDSGAPQFLTAPVTRGDLMQTVTATGSLSPVVNVQVGSQISGRIKSIYADFNSTVKSNQVIAEIDPSTYQVAVLRAEAQLSNSVANYRLAELQARRAASLFNSQLIPTADHDTAVAQLQQAEAEVRTAQANLASANVDLSRCSIVAPVDGVVISRNVDVGQTVASSFNTPTLFIIANDLSKMQIGALVSEADIGAVENGQEVMFRVDAYPDRPFRGKVSQIRYGASTNQNVVNYSAVIDVDNEDLKLLPSMTANVSIVVHERQNVLKLSNAALRFRPPEPVETKTNSTPATPGGRTNLAASAEGAGQRGGRSRGEGRGGPGGGRAGRGGGGNHGAEASDRFSKRTVYILEGQGSEAKLKPVQIRTGISDGISTEVLEGLNEGDQVVTSMLTPEIGNAGPSNPLGGGGRRGGPGGFRRF